MSTPPVELRLSGIPPPTSEPARQIYCDILDAPDPLTMGLTVYIYNQDSVGLYMEVDGSLAGWTFTPKQEGLVAAGADLTTHLGSFATRARPSSTTRETIEIILNAYTDAGYSNLKWTRTRAVTVEFIKSDDGSWDIDEVNDFDDGTKQGWGRWPLVGCGYGITFEVKTNYVLSPPYSLGWTCDHTSSTTDWDRSFRKVFTTPAKDRVFMITNLRIAGSNQYEEAYVRIDDVDALRCSFDVPTETWMRFIVPLPAGVQVTIDVGWEWWNTPGSNAYMWMDDFLIISRDE